MDDLYCALCGVCFDVYTELYDGRVQADDVSWTSFVLALRRVERSSSVSIQPPKPHWSLTGIGQIDGSLGWRGHLPEPGHDARNKNQEVDSENDSYPSPAPAPDNVVPYKRWNGDSEIVYPMHPACWGILCQQYALTAVKNPSNPDLDLVGAIFASQEVEEKSRGLKPDWVTDYAGAENFWGDGWSWSENPETSDVKQFLDEAPDLDFIVFDPEHVGLPTHIVQHPPLLSTDLGQNHLKLSQHKEIFDRLPIEITHMILSLLPTVSVRNIRLASRFVASVPLDNTFWRSRFDFPHELCHVNPLALFASHEVESPIDWRRLRENLLSVPNSEEKGWKNRRRIVNLVRKLVQKLLEDSHGS